MQEKIKEYLNEIEVFTAESKEEVENFRIKYFSNYAFVTRNIGF